MNLLELLQGILGVRTEEEPLDEPESEQPPPRHRRLHRSDFLNAVEAGDVEATRSFIQAVTNLEVRDNGGRTALLIASRSGNIEMVNLLLESGCSPATAGPGGTPCLTHLPPSGKYSEDLPGLVEALTPGHIEVFHRLADVSPRATNTEYDYLSIAMFATWTGDLKLLEKLDKLGQDFTCETKRRNARTGESLLVLAANNHQEAAGIFLLHKGCSADTWFKYRTCFLDSSDHYNALSVAVKNGLVKLVEAMIAAGANLDITVHWAEREVRLLELAEKSNNPAMVELLRTSGVE